MEFKLRGKFNLFQSNFLHHHNFWSKNAILNCFKIGSYGTYCETLSIFWALVSEMWDLKLEVMISDKIWWQNQQKVIRSWPTLAGYSSVMLGWSWIDLSVLGIQLFGQASAQSCAVCPKRFVKRVTVDIKKCESSVRRDCRNSSDRSDRSDSTDSSESHDSSESN